MNWSYHKRYSNDSSSSSSFIASYHAGEERVAMSDEGVCSSSMNRWMFESTLVMAMVCIASTCGDESSGHIYGYRSRYQMQNKAVMRKQWKGLLCHRTGIDVLYVVIHRDPPKWSQLVIRVKAVSLPSLLAMSLLCFFEGMNERQGTGWSGVWGIDWNESDIDPTGHERHERADNSVRLGNEDSVLLWPEL